jgi:hypothetical protein
MAWRSRRPSVLVLLAAVAAVALPRPAAALVDPDPDPTRQTNGRVDAVAYLGNTVYVAGSFTAVRDPSNGSTTARNRLAAFNANSPNQVLPWNPNANNTVRALAVSPAGTRVYAGGAFTSVEGAGRRHLADLGASSGALSKSFKPRVGGGSFPAVLALDVSADGDTLYVGGFFGSIKGVARRNTGAVSTVVAALRAWRPTGTTSTVSSLALFKRPGWEQFSAVVHYHYPANIGTCNWFVNSSQSVLDGFRTMANDVYYSRSSP